MLYDLNCLQVNWVDGMKISRRHFEDTDRYWEERIRDVTAQQLYGYRYGLLPAEGSLDLKIGVEPGGYVRAVLNSCKAVTPNGTRIQVLPGEPLKTGAGIKELRSAAGQPAGGSGALYIVLSIDADRRIPSGELRPEEDPPRHPFTSPSLQLTILPAEQLHWQRLSAGLVIGRLNIHNGEVSVDSDFIPACTAVESQPVLRSWHEKFENMLQEWEQCCITIVQKIHAKSAQQQSTSLVSSILKISEHLLRELSTGKTAYRWLLPHQPPVEMCCQLVEHIHFMQSLLWCYPQKEREEMLSYFAEWAEMQPGAIETQLQQATQASYDHVCIYPVLRDIELAYGCCVRIFQRLAQLDIIGRRKGQHVFVIEQEVKDPKGSDGNSPSKPGGRWSPLS